MAKREWTVELWGTPHTVSLDHSYASGRRRIWVDGELQVDATTPWRISTDSSSRDDLVVGGHRGALSITMSPRRLFVPTYELEVSGIPARAEDDRPRSTPKSTWLFIAACCLLPLATLGGGAAWLIGLAGAWLCVVLARRQRRLLFQVGSCLSVTLIAWAAVLLMTGGHLPWLGPWDYVSQTGAFSVKVSKDLKESVQAEYTSAGTLQTHTFMSIEANRAFGVIYDDYPPDVLRNAGPQRLLDAARNSVVKAYHGTFISESETAIDTYPGRDVVLDVPLGSLLRADLHCRMFLVENRLYWVIALAQKGAGAGGEMDRFLDSFRLLSRPRGGMPL